MELKTESLGDPSVTPFVRFDLGQGVYPPPTIYESAQVVLDRLEKHDAGSLFDGLIERGMCAGQYGVLPRSTWFALLGSFFHYRGVEKPPMAGWRECCMDALRMMVQRPHQSVWPGLKVFLTRRIDDITGWSSSWQREQSEQLKIFTDDDGNYFRLGEDGVLIRVIGAKTLAETRIDFATDQILRPYGFANQFLALFSLFAITDDFEKNRAEYPPAMKAQLTGIEYGRIEHGWYFSFVERTRSFRWRPNSNLCDPLWLGSDLLAGMTDTLEVDYFRRRIDRRTANDIWMKAPGKYQIDHVVESSIRFGAQDEAYFEFEGLTVRWVNGTSERDAVVSISVEAESSYDEAEKKLNRLFTLIAWEHGVSIRKHWGISGYRKPFPVAYSPRMDRGVQVDPQYAWNDFAKPKTEAGWLSLALYREALSSKSDFYAFLSYHKVIETILKRRDDRKTWINTVAAKATRETERVQKILHGNIDLEEYLREQCLNAIKHVWHKPTVNPDDPEHARSIATDLYVVKDFARMAIEKELG